MKSLMPYMLIFCLLIAGAWILGSQDPITDAVVEARSQTSTGVIKMDVLSDAFALLFHITTGGIIATALGWALMNADKIGKMYRRWWSGKLTRRWEPGPNAHYQQQGPRAPKLTREDLLFMALANRDGRVPNMRSARMPRKTLSDQDQEADSEIHIDL